MNTVAVLLGGVTAGLMVGVFGVLVWMRRRTSVEFTNAPPDSLTVVDLVRRVNEASAACLYTTEGGPQWVKGDGELSPELLREGERVAALAMHDSREHIMRNSDTIVALGRSGVSCAVVYEATQPRLSVIESVLIDMRQLLVNLTAISSDAESLLGRFLPDWVVPHTVEGISQRLVERVHQETGRPAAVVARSPLADSASVVAVSPGADPRLLKTPVLASSAVGRACMGDITVDGVGGELFGGDRRNRRQREELGLAYSLRNAGQGVGALVIFGGSDALSEAGKEAVRALVDQAGPLIGNAATAFAARNSHEVDELTGQPNRGGLDRAVSDHGDNQCSLLVVKIEDLENMDSPTGKAALRHVAKLLRQTLRDYDVPARVSEQEFGLFLPDTPFQHAIIVANRVRAQVSEAILEWAGSEISLSCSIGVAAFPDSVKSTDQLLEAARDAMTDGNGPEASSSGPSSSPTASFN